MSWDEIKPRTSVKVDAVCTLSARISGKGIASFSLIIRDPPPFFASGSTVTVLVGRSEHLGLLRIVPDGPIKVAAAPGSPASKRRFQITLPAWLRVAQKQKMQSCEYVFGDDSIEVTLPDWAVSRKAALPQATNSASSPTASSPPARVAPQRRDSVPSVAAIELADHKKQAAATPIDIEAALEWGRRNGLKTSGDQAKDFDRVNAIRRKNQLPPYQLIRPLGPLESLPEATVGGR